MTDEIKFTLKNNLETENVYPKNKTIHVGTNSLFITEKSLRFGYKIISFSETVKDIWIKNDYLHAKDFVLDEKKIIFYKKINNLMNNFGLTPKIYGFKEIKINDFVVPALIIEKIHTINEFLSVEDEKVIELHKKFLSFNQKYKFYDDDFFDYYKYLDLGQNNFGFDQKNNFRYVDLSWQTFIEKLYDRKEI